MQRHPFLHGAVHHQPGGRQVLPATILETRCALSGGDSARLGAQRLSHLRPGRTWYPYRPADDRFADPSPWRAPVFCAVARALFTVALCPEEILAAAAWPFGE